MISFRDKYLQACELLGANFKELGEKKHRRVLICGGGYPGIWIEHNQDNLFITDIAPEEAWNAMAIFMEHQREDGLFPFALMTDKEHPFGAPQFWHVQNILPFVRCAVEVADKVGRPEEDYAAIYKSASKFDAWLVKYRDVRKTGLVEIFCTWDTGHDNSPRVVQPEIPHGCPENNACNLAPSRLLPLLSCDLSAMRFGALQGLAALAQRLGKDKEAALWQEKSEILRDKMLKYLYDPEDEFFYDVTPDGKFWKFRTEHITRIFLNRVLTQSEFDPIYDRYFTRDGKEFRPAYPIPSISVDDPSFVKELPHNCWGCNTQALTMLRALFWMKDYHREADLEIFWSRFVNAVVENDSLFQQELNPFTGAPIIGSKHYTPTLLLLREYGKTHPELLNR